MSEPAAEMAGARTAYDDGRTRSLRWRRTQLAGLRRLVTGGGPELEAALAADLGKPGLETFATELSGVLAEASYADRRLARWTRERRVGVPWTLQPARGHIRTEPRGVVLIVAPWNYPAYLTLMPLVGALAAGNAVVLKPSELAPATSAALARLVPGYLDRDAVRVVEGAAATTTALIEARPDHVFFTGNGTVGRAVLAAAALHLIPVTLELGGRSPVWLDPSADLRVAAREIAWGKFLNAGQTCVAPDHVLTTPETAARFRPLLAARIRAMYGDRPQDSPHYGRIVSDRHTARLIDLLGQGRIVHGGGHNRVARYVEPTVLTDVPAAAPVLQQEVFGPILPLRTVSGLEEGLEVMAAEDPPLAVYAFARDEAVRRRLLEGTRSGAITFGSTVVQLGVPGLPFGGFGASGMGAYHGAAGFRTFSHERAVFERRRGPDLLYAIRAPYTPLKSWLARRSLG